MQKRYEYEILFSVPIIHMLYLLKVIEQSSKSLPSWRDNTTGLQRSKLLSDWSALIKENSDDLGKFIFIG